MFIVYSWSMNEYKWWAMPTKLIMYKRQIKWNQQKRWSQGCCMSCMFQVDIHRWRLVSEGVLRIGDVYDYWPCLTQLVSGRLSFCRMLFTKGNTQPLIQQSYCSGRFSTSSLWKRRSSSYVRIESPPCPTLSWQLNSRALNTSFTETGHYEIIFHKRS